jgi:anti-sigma B factor antagonist
MNKANIVVNVRKPGNGSSIIDIAGEVNAFAESALMDAYTQACNGSTRAIILNFSGLEYMNSSGIGLLVTLLIRVNRHAPRQQLLAYGLSEHYRQIFELTRLNEAIGIYLSEAEAIAEAQV